MFNSDEKNKILKKISEELGNCPTEISVNFICTGEYARKLHHVKTIITNLDPNLNDEDAFNYLIRAGIERELEKIDMILNEN